MRSNILGMSFAALCALSPWESQARLPHAQEITTTIKDRIKKSLETDITERIIQLFHDRCSDLWEEYNFQYERNIDSSNVLSAYDICSQSWTTARKLTEDVKIRKCTLPENSNRIYCDTLGIQKTWEYRYHIPRCFSFISTRNWKIDNVIIKNGTCN